MHVNTMQWTLTVKPLCSFQEVMHPLWKVVHYATILIVIKQDLQKIIKSGPGLETVILIFLQILTYFYIFMQGLISLFWKSFFLFNLNHGNLVQWEGNCLVTSRSQATWAWERTYWKLWSPASLGPRPPPFWSPVCVHNNTRYRKINEN